MDDHFFMLQKWLQSSKPGIKAASEAGAHDLLLEMDAMPI
jgi:hypothetical protein